MKWEYDWTEYNDDNYLKYHLEERGAQGWELVSAIEKNAHPDEFGEPRSDYLRLFWKRPLKEY